MRRVLVLGGTGQTGSRVATILRNEGITSRIAGAQARAETDTDAVRFVWNDRSTHEPAVRDVQAVYLLAPPLDPKPAETMVPFIDLAMRAGVRRFVMLSSSAVDVTDPGLGEVHRYLRDHTPEWAVLRPSWFMQNLVDPRHFLAKSLAAGVPLVTATGTSKVRFVDADDIARVGARALVDERSHDKAHVITGPAAFSYDEVAAILTEVTGIPRTHVAVSTAELVERHVEAGIPRAFAELLAGLDERIRGGAEAEPTSTVLEVTGTPARDFRSFVERNREALGVRP
ncbi:Oxidoreductase [Labilithrix luteola]|uniref:Oxidoreductase n=1 Tax=Labilithrix luteola TaxID=1391654 RepID=A0A0K1PT43_9BACT|nr:NAD(P)H-binding protein [Labilithrix luteola]AKU96692.1 Oxidoreductase [Labilithrix luteola]